MIWGRGSLAVGAGGVHTGLKPLDGQAFAQVVNKKLTHHTFPIPCPIPCLIPLLGGMRHLWRV